METKKSTRKVGEEIEGMVCSYLTKQGLKLRTTNYRCQLGEIDLIFNDGEFIVFTEVRYRKSGDYGNALDSINKNKRNHIIRTATFYLVGNNLYEKSPSRFDVVAVSNENGTLKIDWIKSAFDVSVE